MTREEWRKALRVAIILNDTTMAEVAEKVGCSRQYIWMLSTGKRNSVHYASAVSKLLGIECYEE